MQVACTDFDGAIRSRAAIKAVALAITKFQRR